MDTSALLTMKNAANRDMWCELQTWIIKSLNADGTGAFFGELLYVSVRGVYWFFPLNNSLLNGGKDRMGVEFSDFSPETRDCFGTVSEPTEAVNFDLVKRLKTIFILPSPLQDHFRNGSILIRKGKETNRDSLSNGEWRGKSPNCQSDANSRYWNCRLKQVVPKGFVEEAVWRQRHRGLKPRLDPLNLIIVMACDESSCLRMQLKVADILLAKTKYKERPIANK